MEKLLWFIFLVVYFALMVCIDSSCAALKPFSAQFGGVPCMIARIACAICDKKELNLLKQDGGIDAGSP